MSQETRDHLIRDSLGILAGDDDAEAPDFADLTEAELDEAWATIGRRVSSAMDRALGRIAEKLPHLTAAEWEVIDRTFRKRQRRCWGNIPARAIEPPTQDPRAAERRRRRRSGRTAGRSLTSQPLTIAVGKLPTPIKGHAIRGGRYRRRH